MTFNEKGDVPRTGLEKPGPIAEYLKTTTNQLARWRHEGSGPPYVKLHRSVLYRWEDIHQFVQSNLHQGPQ